MNCSLQVETSRKLSEIRKVFCNVGLCPWRKVPGVGRLWMGNNRKLGLEGTSAVGSACRGKKTEVVGEKGPQCHLREKVGLISSGFDLDFEHLELGVV